MYTWSPAQRPADGLLRLAVTIETRHCDLLSGQPGSPVRKHRPKMSAPVTVVHDEALLRRSFGLRCYPFDLASTGPRLCSADRD